MFNVLLIDDDQIDIDGLSKFINWEELGYKLAGTAHSAAEAVNIIETEFIDVMLTDIVMPGKNGLELIKDALEINPSIKAIILSGYGEFEFAKEAIRLGAFDYLMKPVDLSELKIILNKLKVNLNQDILEKQNQVEFIGIRRTQFLNNLANGFFQKGEDMYKKSAELGLEIDEKEYCLIRLLISEIENKEQINHEKDFVNIKLGLSKDMSLYLNKFGKAYVFDNNLREIAALFYPNGKTGLKDILENFHKLVGSNKSINAFIGAGDIYSSAGDIPKSYFEAGKALDYRYIKKDHLLFYRNIAQFFKGGSIITSDIEIKIQEILLKGDSAIFEKYIFEILSGLYRDDLSDKGILFGTCIEILLIINRCVGRYVNKDILLAQSDHNAIKALLKNENFEDVKSYIAAYLREVISEINPVKDKQLGFAVENVIKYINEHYNENLTLHKLAEVVYMHPTYLSRLFKEKTGENFTEYLSKVRVEHAQKLMENLALRIYDVGEMVGYDSPKHFCKVFKDITGSTPKDYRKQSKAFKRLGEPV